MELRNALQSLRSHGSVCSSGPREGRRSAVVPGDPPSVASSQVKSLLGSC